MQTSAISTSADKISFIRSQLLPGTLASALMSRSSFRSLALTNDYAQFRTNFLEVFDSSQLGAFRWAFQFADSLSSPPGSDIHLRIAADFAHAALDSLTSAGWMDNGTLTADSLCRLLEFQYYIAYLLPEIRRIAAALEFSDSDSLFNFTMKI